MNESIIGTKKEGNIFINNAVCQLPKEFTDTVKTNSFRNGEGLFTDEAEAWKRLLLYRIVCLLKPEKFLETHPGKGTGAKLVKIGNPSCSVISLNDFRDSRLIGDMKDFDIIDIDPFGLPYEAIDLHKHRLKKTGVLMITSGEIVSVVRNLKNSFLPYDKHGRDGWKFVEDIYIPYIESITKLKVQFFYAFPTSVRLILSKQTLNQHLFDGCPNYMWWFRKYAKK